MLYFLVGPSGVGKDSILHLIKNRALPDKRSLLVAHRYITRPPRINDENHVELSNTDFTIRKDSGLFLFNWESHGFNYGIGIEVLEWLNAGHNVIINGSREYIPRAKILFPNLNIIWLTVSESILRERLESRARENGSQIDARIKRALIIEKSKPDDCKTIVNDSLLEHAVDQILNLISASNE